MLKLDGMGKAVRFVNKKGEIINKMPVGIFYDENPIGCRIKLNKYYDIVEADKVISNIKSDTVGAIDDNGYYKDGLHYCHRVGYVGLKIVDAAWNK